MPGARLNLEFFLYSSPDLFLLFFFSQKLINFKTLRGIYLVIKVCQAKNYHVLKSEGGKRNHILRLSCLKILNFFCYCCAVLLISSLFFGCINITPEIKLNNFLFSSVILVSPFWCIRNPHFFGEQLLFFLVKNKIMWLGVTWGFL